MSDMTTALLRAKGLRATAPRVLAFRTLASGEHYRVEALWDQIRAVVPGIELSTVYRIVDSFVAAGLARTTILPDGSRVVEAEPAFHPHVLCDTCGRIFHLPDDAARRVTETLQPYAVEPLLLVGRGRCPACSTSREQSP
jgi:Fe2+ or Zn2+ uptake regulation protein